MIALSLQCTFFLGGTTIQAAELPIATAVPPTISRTKNPPTTTTTTTSTTTTTTTSQPHHRVISSTSVPKVANPTPVVPVLRKLVTEAPPKWQTLPADTASPSSSIPPKMGTSLPPQKVMPVHYSSFTNIPHVIPKHPVKPKRPPFNRKQPPFIPKHTPLNPTRVPISQKHPPYNAEQHPINPTYVPVNPKYPPVNPKHPPYNPERHPDNPARRPTLDRDLFTVLTSRPTKESHPRLYPTNPSPADPIDSVNMPRDQQQSPNSPVDGVAGHAGFGKGIAVKSSDDCGGCLNGGTCLSLLDGIYMCR